MTSSLSTIVIAGLAVTGSVGYIGYRLTTNAQEDIAIINPTPSPTIPLVTSVNWQTTQATALPTATPKRTTSPSPSPLSRPQFTPSPSANTQQATTQIVFIDLPNTVHSGQSFVAKWRIEGQTGATGTNTSLKVSYETNVTRGDSHSSTSSNNSQSFGSFTVPATFSTNLSYGGNPGAINVIASAEIDGRTITATRTVTLVD